MRYCPSFPTRKRRLPPNIRPLLPKDLFPFVHHDRCWSVLIRNSLYVDDFAGGACTDSRAYEVYKSSKSLMSKGCFTLRKWNTNSKELRARIESEKTGIYLQAMSLVIPSSVTMMIAHKGSSSTRQMKIAGRKFSEWIGMFLPMNCSAIRPS